MAAKVPAFACILLFSIIGYVASVHASLKPSFTHKAGKLQIMSFEDPSVSSSYSPIPKDQVILVDTKSGWGTGAHPTTRLCLDFLTNRIVANNIVLDYGTGSGILSIVAAKLGAIQCLAVDIDDDTLIAARRNVEINQVGSKVEVIHTKSVYIGDDSFPTADITVANILPGPLSRLVAPLWFMTKPGGWLCLSGMRPHELPGIKRIYEPYVDVSSEVIEQQSHSQFGDWVSWQVRTKCFSAEERREKIGSLSELSVC